MSEPKTCETCQFYSNGETVDKGQCVRYPPISQNTWPWVKKTDWCGEYLKK